MLCKYLLGVSKFLSFAFLELHGLFFFSFSLQLVEEPLDRED